MARTASTQRNDTSSRPVQAGQPDAVRELVVHAARIELASITVASKLFAGWAQSADRYAQAISAELLGRVQGETASRELVRRLAVVSSTHLREVTALPSVAVTHFNSELTKTVKPRKRARRDAPGRAAVGGEPHPESRAH
jgi:hypothetical protein